MPLKLWVYHGGASPRRAIIYLAERGFPSNVVDILPTTMAGPGAPANAPGKPPGAVPLLMLENGKSIHESIAILEYFEDLADARGLQSMRGHTPQDRASVREMLGLTEQVTISIELAAVHGCVAFAPGIENAQSAPSVRWLLRYCHQQLDRIAEYASPKGPFLVNLEDDTTGRRVTIADCVLFAILQYAQLAFGFDLAKEHPRVQVFYDAFKGRPSAFVPDSAWPPQVTAMMSKWIEY